MEIFVTSQVLKSGIIKTEAEPYLNRSRHSLIISMRWECENGEGRDWHRTYDVAKQYTETLRTAEISRLRGEISRLEKMEF